MKKHPELAFFITGLAFMLLIAAVKFATKADVGLVGLLVSFAFGGVVGLLAFKKKEGFLKDLVFIGAFAWVLWAALVPIATVGGNWVVNKVSLLAIVTVIVIFFEQDVLNLLRDKLHRKKHFTVGFFGVLALMVFLSVSGLSDKFFGWLSAHLVWAFVAFLAWLVFLYVIINKGVSRLLGGLTKRLEGRK